MIFVSDALLSSTKSPKISTLSPSYSLNIVLFKIKWKKGKCHSLFILCYFACTYVEPKGAVAYKEKSAVTSAYLLASHIAPRKATPGPGSYEVCELL